MGLQESSCETRVIDYDSCPILSMIANCGLLVANQHKRFQEKRVWNKADVAAWRSDG